jgi:hypothetical protein
MLIVKSIDQYNSDFVYFCEPIRNNIVKNGHFIRIIYSNDFVSLNGIYLILNMIFSVGNIFYNKIKCSFDINKNRDIITNIQNIEINLLSKLNITNKTPQYNIYEQMKNGNIKIILEDNLYERDKIKNIVLKIAGIWETNTEYGLTFKFMSV